MSDEILSTPPPQIKKRFKNKDEGLWLYSFCDLSLLMMCFFALQLSFSTMDKRKFENISEALEKTPPPPKTSAASDDTRVPTPAPTNLKQISEKLLQEIKAQRLNARVTYDAEGVNIEFDEQMLFKSGSAVMSSTQSPLADRLLNVIARSPQKYRLVFEGHTDDVPLTKNAPFSSNWELSSARGLALLRNLQRRGITEDRMSVVSYAHTRPKIPIKQQKGKDLLDARRANRRVVIKIQ